LLTVSYTAVSSFFYYVPTFQKQLVNSFFLLQYIVIKTLLNPSFTNVISFKVIYYKYMKNFYVLLTVHLSINLDNDQLDAHLFYFTIRLL